MAQILGANNLILQHFQPAANIQNGIKKGVAMNPVHTIPARDLTIYKANDPLIWSWHSEVPFDDVAELIVIEYLKVEGTVRRDKHGCLPLVNFVIKMRPWAKFPTPVTLTIGNQEKSVDLKDITPETWYNLTVNKLVQGPIDVKNETVKFSMTNFDKNLKSGLVIAGAWVLTQE